MKNLKLLVEYAQDLVLLYAEDHDETREEVGFLLESIFDNIIVAKDGLEALEYYKKTNNIDIVITDINMPNMDGMELIKEIKKIDNDTKIIVFSAYENKDYLSQCIDLNVDGFLSKPLDEKKYFETLFKVVDQIQTKKQLDQYKNSLELKVQEQLNEIMLKDDILEKHAKFAAMGEMIDIIAHQWKSPLNIISLRVGFVSEIMKEEGEIEASEIEECGQSVKTQVKHLVDTLDHFRSFFRPNTIVEEISLNDLYDSISVLLHDQLIKNQITLTKEFENLKFSGNLNEIKHIFINFINNAKDAFNQNKIEDRQIKISAKKTSKGIVIKVKDNAGGIPEHILPKIFEANFTTKSDIGGTGIGLYMCKTIATKYNYELDVEVYDGKTEFILNIPVN